MADFDITTIPSIMRANNWPVGASLMDKWFSGAANSNPERGVASTTQVTMAWVLGYPRALQVYNQLVREKVWINPAAQAEIIKLLKRKDLLKEKAKSFGMPKTPLPVADNDSIQFRVVGGNWDIAFGPMDDLKAALARFTFNMLVVGNVEPLFEEVPVAPGAPSHLKVTRATGEYTVTITEVGIYIKDSYDFNDPPEEDQSLGNWDAEDNSVGKTMFNGGDAVHNSDFRKWRQQNNQGGDFLVYSDIRYLTQTTHNTFTFKK